MKLGTEGIVVYDAHLQRELLLVAPVEAVLGGNPRASEVMSLMGSSANKFCRMCMVGYVRVCALSALSIK